MLRVWHMPSIQVSKKRRPNIRGTFSCRPHVDSIPQRLRQFFYICNPRHNDLCDGTSLCLHGAKNPWMEAVGDLIGVGHPASWHLPHPPTGPPACLRLGGFESETLAAYRLDEREAKRPFVPESAFSTMSAAKASELHSPRPV